MREKSVDSSYWVQVPAGTVEKSAQKAKFVSANGALAYITELVQGDQRRIKIQGPHGPITMEELRQRADEEMQGARQVKLAG